jgi:hypothetical protein
MNETPVVRRTVKKSEPKYEPTPDAAFPETAYDEARENLIKFVEFQVGKMRDRLLFNEEPTFSQLNEALAAYESTSIALLSSYAAARAEDSIAREVYDDEYARCFVETRTELGLNKYASGKELELLTRARHMEKLSKLKAKCIEAETKIKFIDKLVDSWKTYGFTLNQLSRNAEVEAKASGLSTNDLVGEALGE